MRSRSGDENAGDETGKETLHVRRTDRGFDNAPVLCLFIGLGGGLVESDGESECFGCSLAVQPLCSRPFADWPCCGPAP